MASSSVYSITFNNFNFLTFDNLNLSIAIFIDLNLLVLNNLQFFIMHDKILDVDIVHMQAITTHFFVIGTHFAMATNFIEVEVMQLAIIQVQAQVWKSHS
jgi:hypothetical protein